MLGLLVGRSFLVGEDQYFGDSLVKSSGCIRLTTPGSKALDKRLLGLFEG